MTGIRQGSSLGSTDRQIQDGQGPQLGREPRGLWQALVDADAVRSSFAEPCEIQERGTGVVIDLAAHAQAHLGYLERLGFAVVTHASDELGRVVGGDATVVDLADHRSRRALIA